MDFLLFIKVLRITLVLMKRIGMLSSKVLGLECRPNTSEHLSFLIAFLPSSFFSFILFF